jgi:hypothetical protein
MGKRRPHLSDEWLRDIWNVRPLNHAAGELDGFDKLVSSAVSQCLSGDEWSRGDVAQYLSELLNEQISGFMLDAYASEARRDHPITGHRFLALIAITRRFDILDAVLREIGGKALSSGECMTFKLGLYYSVKLTADRRLEEVMDQIFDVPNNSEDQADIAAAENAEERRRDGAEYLPSEFVSQILDGENPLRVWRKHRGMTLKALAGKSGVSYSYISELERGLKEPGSVWSKLATALDAAVEDILPG